MKRDPEALEGREHDLLVIGGGIAGAWAVYEAASRGLKAALVELDDFGQATSWSSFKTAHGGLRHLQRLDVAGFRESVVERRALLRVAPEVVRPLNFAIAAPSVIDHAKFFLGGFANDVLSSGRNEGLRADRMIGASRIVTGAEIKSIGAEALASDRVFVWQDAQITHTERLLMGVLHGASSAGAVLMNHCRIDSVQATASGFMIRATDKISDRAVPIRTRSVINATGAQLEEVARLFQRTCESPPLIRGVNVVLGREIAPLAALGTKDQGRFLFLAPWQGRSILGTIYDDGSGPVDRLVKELLEAGQRAFPWAHIQTDDVRVVHSGHVPGTAGEPIYRSRVIVDPRAPFVSILTAKYTTARATAIKAVEALSGRLSLALRPSVSATTPLTHAKPLSGTAEERLAFAEEQEMAMTRRDAIRGRLVEGALGDEGLL